MMLTTDPAPVWLNLRVNQDADPAVRVTVGADTTTYTYKGISTGDDLTVAQMAANAVESPTTGQQDNTFADPLSASNVRWFRVIAITNENDGDDTTGGMQVDVGDGTIEDGDEGAQDAPSMGELLPEPDDMGNALAKDGRTAAPASAPGQDPDVAPAAPVDLTAEKASDTDLPGAEERGVLLLWNEPKGDGEITSYVIERRIDGGTPLTIDAITWASDTDPDQRTSYTDPREPVAGEMLEYRVGSRGSAVTETQWADWITYSTHQTVHSPTAPQMVMAAATSDTMITVTWEAPASNGGSAITGYMVQRAYMMDDGTMSEWMDVDPAHTGMDMEYVDTGLMPYTTYYYRVAAMNAEGMGSYSDGMAMESMAMTHNIVPGMPTGVSAMADGRTQINVSWDAPASNGGSDVIGYTLARKYGEMDFMTIAATDSASWWNTLDCAMMNDAVEDHVGTDGPAVGPDDMTSPYCALYAGLSDAAEAVVDRAFAASGYDTITGTSYMDMGLMPMTEYMYQVTAVNAAGASMPSDTASATTVANMAPTAAGMISAVTVTEGMMSDAMDVSGYFSDAEGDALTYTAMSSDDMVATASVDGSMVTITGVAAGMATIMVTATDAAGAYAMQTIAVTVNAVPMAVGEISAVTVTEGMMSDAMDVSGYFSDTEGDTLTYTAMSSDDDGLRHR